jgi:hypothetical protein
MDATTTSSSIIDRMIRASRLEADVYEEVEHDPDATTQAAIIVIGTSILAGIGGFGGGFIGIIVLAALSLVGWAVYAWITYFIGTRLLAGPETSASWSELARTLGYASSPRALLVVASVPILGPLVAAVVAIWVLVTSVVAIRAALDFDTWRAVATAIIGWIAQGILFGLAFAFFVA